MHKAWVIQWDWFGDNHAVRPNILHILPPQWGASRVADYLVTLASNSSEIMPSGRLHAHRNRKLLFPIVREGPRIICGSNPFLIANRVTDLRFRTDPDTNDEIAEWTSVPGIGFGPDPFNPPRLGEPVAMIARFSPDGVRLG